MAVAGQTALLMRTEVTSRAIVYDTGEKRESSDTQAFGTGRPGYSNRKRWQCPLCGYPKPPNKLGAA